MGLPRRAAPLLRLLLSLGLGLCGAAGCKRWPESLRDQVRKAKPALDGHARLADYHESPYQPAAIVERVHQQGTAQAWDALCGELAPLPDDQLELFEDSIRMPEHAQYLGCGDALLERIDNHWRNAAQGLAAAHPAGAAVAALPSVELAVDVSKDQVFTDGHLAADQIAITFDDGPHVTRTARVLAILQRAGVRATFFEIGRNASAHPEISRQVVAAGHTVGSHTFSHPNLPKLPEGSAESEIESGDASVSLALGVSPGQVPFFRFPYGARTSAEQGFVQKRGYTTFAWNMDSEDWRIRDPKRLFANVVRQLDRAKHGIILFHDIHEQTVIVLPHLLAELAARHLKTVVFVPASASHPADWHQATPRAGN